MPDSLNANGLTVKTASEITTDLVAGLQAIYGADINVDQNSPDGQEIGIFTQINVDIRELLIDLYNTFDPDLAYGDILDQRVTINNIQRIGGTYTVQPVDITVNQTVTLNGLDDNYSDPNGAGYTIQDASGNEFILAATVTITSGTHTLNFRAKQIGAVNVPINTITIPVTIILGVTAINNSTGAISVGQNQESDAQLRTRRAQSVSIASTGYLNGLLGAILALPGVTEATLYENVTNSTDGNGIPAHGIWLIVAGGSHDDIANTIYGKKSYGANMKGAINVDIITQSGGLFIAKFDNPTAVNLYIQFTIQTTVSGTIFATTAIKNYIAQNLKYKIGAFAETSAVTLAASNAINAQGGGGVPVLVQISNDNSTWTDYLAAPTLDSQWTLDPAHISITVV